MTDLGDPAKMIDDLVADLVWLEGDFEARARVLRRIEKIAADAAHRIEHEILEAGE